MSIAAGGMSIQNNNIYYTPALKYEIVRVNESTGDLEFIKPKVKYFKTVTSEVKNPFRQSFSTIRALYKIKDLFFVGVSPPPYRDNKRTNEIPYYDLISNDGSVLRERVRFDYPRPIYRMSKKNFLTYYQSSSVTSDGKVPDPELIVYTLKY